MPCRTRSSTARSCPARRSSIARPSSTGWSATWRPARRSSSSRRAATASRRSIRQALTRRHAARRAHGRGHRQQLQLLPVVPRGIRAGACGGRDALGARARLAHRRSSPRRVPRSATSPRTTGPGRFSVVVPAGPQRPRRQSPGERGLRAARPAGRRNGSAPSSSRSTSSRPSTASTAAASSTRCAPPPSISGRSATSSPAPSRA